MSVKNSALKRVPPVEPSPEVLPATPPAEVMAAIDAAFTRSAELAAAGRELHFSVHGNGWLAIEVRDRAGDVVRTLRPSQALSLMDDPRDG